MIDIEPQVRPLPSKNNILGVILAGGQSRRMGGGDKCLIELGGKPVLEHILERSRPQLANWVINTNSTPEAFAAYDLPIIADKIKGFAGPLSGIHAGMKQAEANGLSWIVSVPADTPFLPEDLVDLLLVPALEGADLVCAASNGRHHPVVGLWPVDLLPELEQALMDGLRKIDRWTAQYNLKAVEFSSDNYDPFFNTNRPEDLKTAQELIERFKL